jgi:hypothetical protein
VGRNVQREARRIYHFEYPHAPGLFLSQQIAEKQKHLTELQSPLQFGHDTCLIAVRADDKRFGNINDLPAS